MKSILNSCFLRKWLGVALVFPLATLNVVWGEVLPITPKSQEVSPVDEAVIDRAMMEAISRVQKLAATDPGEFATILHKAFGERLSPNAARDLVQKAAHRQLPLPKRILFVPAKVLAGAAAAYATDNGGALLINAEFRERSAALPGLITHEWGHHLDATLGSGDAPGEEGQIFLTGIENSGPILAALQGGIAALENHHATIEFEGRTMAVELGFFDFIAAPFKAVANAVKKVANFVADTAKAVVNTVVSTVKSTVSFVKNTVKAVGNAVVGAAQSVASGIMRATGNNAQADALLAKAKGSFGNAFSGLKGAANDVVSRVAAVGDLYNQTTANLNKVVPHLGTVLGVAATFTPAGPYLAAVKGVADVKNAYENGGIIAALNAGAFAALDVGGSALGRVAGGIKAAKAANAVTRARAGAVVSKGGWFAKAQGVAKTGLSKVDAAKQSTLGTWKYTKATTSEIARGTSLVNNWQKTTKLIDVLNKVKTVDIVVRTKDFIPGSARDEDTGKHLGKGGTGWDKTANAVKDQANKAADVLTGTAAPVAKPPSGLHPGEKVNKSSAGTVPLEAGVKAQPDAAVKAKADPAIRAQADAAARAQAAADALAASKAKAAADALAAAKAKTAADALAEQKQWDADRAARRAREMAQHEEAVAANARKKAAEEAQTAADARAAAAARAQIAAETKAQADAAARAQGAADTKAQADAAARAQAAADARAQAAADAKAQAAAAARAQVAADAKAQAAADAKAQVAADAKAQVAADAKAQAAADAKAQAAADAKAQAAADANAQAAADKLEQQREETERAARKARELAQHEEAVAANARKKAAADANAQADAPKEEPAAEAEPEPAAGDANTEP